MIILDIEQPKSCNACPMCFKLGNASICIIGHMPIVSYDAVDENCPIISDVVSLPESTSSASWEPVEFDEPLPFGGMLTRRGFKCSSCGEFRSKKKGRSRYCEVCGKFMINNDMTTSLSNSV